MQETYTWRELLHKIITDVHERQRIAELLKINPVTLTRWASNKSSPRPESLRQLLDVLPSQRQNFVELLAREYPQFFLEDKSQDEILTEIPASFYEYVLKTHITSPAHLRASTIRTLILQQILNHLDHLELGMGVLIAQCQATIVKTQTTSSTSGRKIRSLRSTLGQGTDPWSNHEHQTYFFGAESLAGHAALSGHYMIAQSHTSTQNLFLSQQETPEESAIAYPILLSDHIAGVLSIVSTQSNFFTTARLELIASYTELLTLGFDPCDFHRQQDLDLGIMPSFAKQQANISNFQQRVVQWLILAQQNGEMGATRTLAEAHIWHEIEEFLLSQA
ncbi:GAF domain-containing protein [Ktedonospora formicarum]|uniref:GAF domain-containing protein n=1 Tax=Ktedonospora formicarum TaxID=2778364 RepID=A0A8J3I2I2_9CHLR|nr:GAF domain-containing protein [Ktedonospora formicarum]GHO43719.1 hypothetical protein KSX_18820 [Ktedonospora formicarum]